ncbi:hypothetical protein Q7P35_000776 [Cladosporium inversicolor]
MRLPTLLTTLTSLLTLLAATTTARITGFSAPSTIVPGAPIQIHLRAENYIQRVQDVAVAFGITPTEQKHPRSLGTFVGEKFLGPEYSNIIGNITANVSIPTSRPEGSATITAALFSLYGVSLTGSVEYFAVNVTVGNETSSEYVVSEYEVEPVERVGERWRA